METKEGEIFEYNGEWYQCIVENGCENCAFNERKCYTIVDECGADRRKDNKNVIFKKLEKVGEPYTHYCPSGRIIYFQRYKIFNKSYSHNTKYIMCDFNEDGIVSIELKQTKENMEENKLNLKPFDLEAARSGKPVCTRDGRNARIICFDYQNENPIIVLIQSEDGKGEDIYEFKQDGKVYNNGLETVYDLMMLPEKKEGWVNIYKSDNGIYYTGAIFYEKNDALVNTAEIEITTGIPRDCIDTINISWEE